MPVHIDDLTAAILALLDTNLYRRCRIPLVGPRPTSLRDFLARLRHAMGLGKARFLPLPMSIVRAGARLGQVVPGSLLDTETLGMLLRGNTGDAGPVRRLLSHDPRRIEKFITVCEAPWLFTTPTILFQLPSGLYLAHLAGFPLTIRWRLRKNQAIHYVAKKSIRCNQSAV